MLHETSNPVYFRGYVSYLFLARAEEFLHLTVLLDKMKNMPSNLLPKTLKMAAVRAERRIASVPAMRAINVEAIEGEGIAWSDRLIPVVEGGELKSSPEASTVRPPRPA